ncbi:hypothetical protein BDR04DRAFT_310818 [Suillus decipiens]|nr:hypothetical protein BDR04DRAFT_310818 [Suillus decipiens]
MAPFPKSSLSTRCSTTMDSPAPFNLILWYTMDKHPNTFWLSIPSNSEIAELKSAIYLHLKDGPLRAKVLPQELILWKLTIQVLISPHETVGERVKAMDPKEIAVELENDNQKVSQAFPEISDTEQELHLTVHIGKPSPPPSTTRSSTPWTLLDNEHISASAVENLSRTNENTLLIGKRKNFNSKERGGGRRWLVPTQQTSR